jgi:tetratricopeptide (TPR) repeat protein
MSDKKLVFAKYLPAVLGLLVFIIYLLTLAPSVIQIDSGELTAVQATLGIAHPTGYPLFTIIGYLFLKLPLPFTIIYKANLLAAIWCLFGILFFIKSITLLLQNFTILQRTDKKVKNKKQQVDEYGGENNKLNVLVSSVTGALFLAFSKTYWMQSTSVEVYSLQIFLFTLIIYASLNAFFSQKESLTDWIWAGIALAFGFSNHMTTLLTLPFIAILFFLKEGFKKHAFKKVLITFIASFPIIILFYLYLPIRASSNPVINWGNPINLENIFRHVSGKQYQVWLFSSMDAAKKQLVYFIENLPTEFTIPGLLLALIGLGYIFKQSIKLFWILTISFLTALLYSINYDIVDIDSYFLFNNILIAGFISFGIYWVILWLQKKYRLKEKFFVLLIAFGLLPTIINFNSVDQSEQHAFEDYTKAILESVEKNAIIFSYQWDYFISASYYFQFVENFRSDVAVVDKELLRRSWYYTQLERSYPAILKNIKNDISEFLVALRPFESSESFDPNLLEKNYRNVMTKLVSENPDKDFYVGLELYANEMQRGEFSLPKDYQLIPHLFLFKATKSQEYVTAPEPDFKIRLPKRKDKYILFIEDTIGRMLTYRIAYELQNNKTDKAISYFKKLREGLPEFQIPTQITEKINLLIK